MPGRQEAALAGKVISDPSLLPPCSASGSVSENPLGTLFNDRCFGVEEEEEAEDGRTEDGRMGGRGSEKVEQTWQMDDVPEERRYKRL